MVEELKKSKLKIEKLLVKPGDTVIAGSYLALLILICTARLAAYIELTCGARSYLTHIKLISHISTIYDRFIFGVDPQCTICSVNERDVGQPRNFMSVIHRRR